MEINLIYSTKNAEQIKAARFVREAVKNLGISACITELDSIIPKPRVVVNGFDLLKDSTQSKPDGLSYEQIEQALEQTAW